MQVIVAPPALQELTEAIDFYSDEAAGLAHDLVDEFDEAIVQISRLPKSGVPYHHGTRRVVLRRFPFSIVYRVRGEVAEVVALAHQRRKPDYWADRA